LKAFLFYDLITDIASSALNSKPMQVRGNPAEKPSEMRLDGIGMVQNEN
jgi:hypothetical protein